MNDYENDPDVRRLLIFAIAAVGAIVVVGVITWVTTLIRGY